MYSDEPEGVVRAASEYVMDDDDNYTANNVTVQSTAVSFEDIFVYMTPTMATAVATMEYVRQSNRLAEKPKLTWNKNHEHTSSKKVDVESKHTVTLVVKPTPQKVVDEAMQLKNLQDDISDAELDSLPDLISDDEDSSLLSQTGNTTAQNDIEADQVFSPNLSEFFSEEFPVIRIPDSLRNCYSEDKFFANILVNPTHYKDFEFTDGLHLLKWDNRRILCIPNIRIGERNVREIVISHAHSILAHLGSHKTMFYLRENVWWPSIVKDVSDFCQSCSLCAMSKSSTQQPMGLLHTLEIPWRPWQAVGIDFVGPLPVSQNRYGKFDQICVIIDHLTSMVHLVPTKTTYQAKHIAELIFETVYKLHGLPERIISDRDSLFTSVFWQELHKLLGTELRLLSSYHPQTDGATERANRTMTQMLRQCVALDQKDWVSRLPAIEYAMHCA